MHDFPVQGSKLLLDAPIIAVRRDQILMPGGSVRPREIVEHFGAVAIVALRQQPDNGAAELLLLRQYRPAVGKYLWELPAGLLDYASEDALLGAQRELKEEAGLAANKWELLTDLISSPGFCDEAVRIYLATELSEVAGGTGEDDEEACLEHSWVPLEQAVVRAVSGDIENSIAKVGILATAVQRAGLANLRPAASDFPLRPQALASRRRKQLADSGDLNGAGDLKQPGS